MMGNWRTIARHAAKVAMACAIILPAQAQPAFRGITTADIVTMQQIGGEGPQGVLTVSHDGRAVAFQTQTANLATQGYDAQWRILRIDGRDTPINAGDGGAPILASGRLGRLNGSFADAIAQWSPDDRWIAYLRQEGDEIQVWRSRTDGSHQEAVTAAPANVLRFAWRPDGKAIFFGISSYGLMAVIVLVGAMAERSSWPSPLRV